ncbi:hypothetical protein AAU61_19700 [Desulfocarbo indianensis]|nr:hypothetical protein AAU61_19700 [Desulfocarbo indianensis]
MNGLNNTIAHNLDHKRPLALILLLTLLARLAWLAYAQPVPVSDFAQYLDLARSILEHGQYGYPTPTAFRTPGYPAYLVPFLALHNSWAAAMAANLVLSLAGCLLVFGLTRRLFPDHPRAALAGALVYGLNPNFIIYTGLLASENLYGPLMMGALYLALGRRRRLASAALAGLLLGWAGLTRGEGLILAAVPFFLFALQGARRLELDWRRAGAALILFVACLSVVLPWWWRNRVEIGPGAGLVTLTGVFLYEAYNPNGYGYSWQRQDLPVTMNEVERNKKGASLAWQYVKEHPERLPAKIARSTFDLYRPTFMPVYMSTRSENRGGAGGYPAKPLPGVWLAEQAVLWGYLALLALALPALYGWRKWPGRAVWVVAGVAGLNWLVYGLVFWGMGRYRLLPELLFCCLAGVTLARLFNKRLAGEPDAK